MLGVLGRAADHYQGLTDTWDAGPIYCSEVTARLVVKIIGVHPKFVHPLPFDQVRAVQKAEHLGSCPEFQIRTLVVIVAPGSFTRFLLDCRTLSASCEIEKWHFPPRS